MGPRWNFPASPCVKTVLFLSMLVLSVTPAIEAKFLNTKWSNAALQGSSSTDTKIHLVLVACYNT